MLILIFQFLKRIIVRLTKEYFSVDAFCDENDFVHLVYLSDKTFEDCMDLLLITGKNKSHYVYIKDFNRFMCNMTKNENKKHFCRYCL